MDIQRQKATQFIHRLLANPGLQDSSPIQKEDQIVQFLKVNGDKLFPTLSTNAFFPGQSWSQIHIILIQTLREVIDQSLLSQLQRIIGNIDFGFIAFLRENSAPVAGVGESILEFQKRLLQKNEARTAFVGPYMALHLGLINHYIDQIFQRKEYIYFELVKVQKLKMSKEEIKNLISTSLLLKNAIHLLTNGGSSQGNVTEVVQMQFAEKAFSVLKKPMKLLPDPLLRSSVNSNVSFIENPAVETTARLASIFAYRCQNYRPIKKLDRGADSPDKSWFSIARRNFKFYGFDIKMLDELYIIAGENGW